MTKLFVYLFLFSLSLAAQPNQFVNLEIIPRMDNTTRGELRFRQLRPTNRYVGFRAPAAIPGNTIWTLPSADSAGCFQSNGTGTISIATCSSAPFVDTTAIVKGSVDATKLLRFEVDGLTTATTRVLTPQDADYTLAGTNLAQTFTANQTFQDIRASAGDTYNLGLSGTRFRTMYSNTIDLRTGASTAAVYVRNAASNARVVGTIDGSDYGDFEVLDNATATMFRVQNSGITAARTVTPSTTYTYNLGSTSLYWNGFYNRFIRMQSLSAGSPASLDIRDSSSNLLFSMSDTGLSAGDFRIYDAGAPKFEVYSGQTNIATTNLSITGTTTFTGTLQFSANNLYNIGSSTNQARAVYLNQLWVGGVRGLTTTVIVPCGTLTFTEGVLTNKGTC